MKNIINIIGNTPIVELQKIKPSTNVRIFAKLEFLNPTGSHKDRAALYMIKEAIKKHNLKPGDIIVEASSGNTGISVAFVAQRLV
jgi:cysteine synthase (EC 2.5.1.47)